MREEDVNSVLEKLGRGQLHALTHQLGFDFQSRLTQDYIEYLSGIEWNQERLDTLKIFYIQQLINRSSQDVSLYFLPVERNFNQIRENISGSVIDNIDTIYNNEQDDGFQIIQNDENIISGNYYFATDKIIPDLVRKELTNVRVMNVIKFEADNRENCVKIYDNLPAHYTKFHRTFRETTEIELQIKGLFEHGSDSMNRVRDFLRHYTIRDAEEIILFFPQTLREHIHKITYDGQDIFQDEGVRNHITQDDAIVTGFTVQIEYMGYNFRVKVGSNGNMGYVSVKAGTRVREASDLVEKYRNHFL